MINPNKIIDHIANRYGVSVSQLTGRSRVQNVNEARCLYCLIAREVNRMSYRSIGSYINRDNSTVVHGIKRICELIDAYPEMHSLYKEIRDEIAME